MPSLLVERSARGSTLLSFALIGAIAGCGDPESPFDMWDMRIGMPFAELDDISAQSQGDRFTCSASAAGYRSCSVPLRDGAGRMEALLDGADRVVGLTFWTGAETLTSNLLTDGGESYDMLMGLINRTHRLASEWRAVTASDTVFSEDVGWTETWSAGEGRWIAQIIWRGTGQPDMIAVTDAEAAHAHALAEAREESGIRSP